MAITAFLSRSPGLLNRGPGGPASLGHVPHSSIFSPTGLISNWSIGILRPPSAGCWFSLPHLISNSLNFLCTKLYDCSTTTCFLWGVTNRTHSTRRPDAAVIYTGAFPILTAWRGSICCNTFLIKATLFTKHRNKSLINLQHIFHFIKFSKHIHTHTDLGESLQSCNLLNFLLRCGSRPHELDTQWDSNSLAMVC